MGKLNGKTIAILATDGYEQSELMSPKHALEAEGARVDVIAPHEGRIRGWKDKNWAEAVDVTSTIEMTDAGSYDALMLPGGVMNPDQLRSDQAAVAFVGAFVGAKKPIAAICHGPWTLIEAGAVKGLRMTSYPSIKTDLINAGAKWVDETVVVDRGIVTSRKPDDLPAFNQLMVEVFAAGGVAARRKKKAATEARAKRPSRSTPRSTKQKANRR